MLGDDATETLREPVGAELAAGLGRHEDALTAVEEALRLVPDIKVRPPSTPLSREP